MDWLFSILLLVVGGYVAVMNWAIVYYGLVHGRHSSWAPLVGGLLLAVGLARFPVDTVAAWWWLPFLLDWGCAPGLTVSAIFALKGSRER